MKIAINSLPLTTGHKTRGIGFYTRILLESLVKIPGIEVIEFNNIKDVKDAEVVHFPFFDLFFRSLPIQQKFPTVVTIHDVTPLIFSKNFPPGIKGRLNFFWQKIALNSVKAVITDSLSSKKDINKYLGVPESKIFSIPLAPARHFQQIKDSQFLKNIRDKYDLPKQFVLYTGNINWNKNLINLSQACIESGVDLVLLGSGFEKKEGLDHAELSSYKEFLSKYSNNPKIHIKGFVPDEDLVAILNQAEILLLPSFYEGFGLPILEAQACGVPVITSNLSSMPEVAGEGAILVDPQSVTSVSQAINNILSNTQIRDNLIRLGLENVKKYSWEQTARETAEVYHSVIKNK